MTEADAVFDQALVRRPVWLITLADLSLLLVGFFVLLQAHGTTDRARVTRGIAAALGAAPEPVAVEAMRVSFAPGSAVPTPTDALVRWAREATRDPRISLRLSAATDGTAADRDTDTASAAVLAADRARAIAAALVRGGIAEERFSITVDPRARARAVTVTLAFTGEERNTR